VAALNTYGICKKYVVNLTNQRVYDILNHKEEGELAATPFAVSYERLGLLPGALLFVLPCDIPF
jgi:hypothetical protein